MFNNLTIVGNLVTDFKQSGEVAHSRIASTFAKDKTIFLDVKAFGKAAETLISHGSKGTKLLLSGRLQCDTWEGQDGKKRISYSLIIDRFEFISKPKGEEAPKEPDADDLPF